MIAAAGVLLLATPAAPAASIPAPGQRAGSVRAPDCTLKGAKTIAANRHVRVFTARIRRWREVFGCRRDADRAFAIGDANGECQNYDDIDGAVVSGNFVALNVHTCSLDSSQSAVKLLNLRDGRVRFASLPLATNSPPTAYDAIRGMVLTATGRLAWIGVRVERGAVVAAQVRRRLPRSQRGSAVLDSGTGIDPRSLRRRGSEIRWRNAGVARSAAI